MLTVKAPLEIKAKTSYIRDPESFYYRILGNYSLIQTPVAEEDLLHIAATPPEIYITEGEGISNFLNHSVRNESNYNKVQILNNVLNRIVVSADMNLTYQDRVFITDALYKLGVKDDRKFMNSFYRMAEETRNTNALINLYFEQGQDLKAMVETFSSKTEKEKTTEKETLKKEPRNFLYNNIFDRLSTGAVYQIVSNFNRSVDYNEIDKNEYSLSTQIYTAQNMLLSVLRERAGLESRSLALVNQNIFEEAIENMSEDITNVQNQISSAVMMDILQNIYRTGFEKFISSQDMYFRFEDTFYRSSDQVIQRLISSYGTSVSRQDVNEYVFEENNELLQNELRLFGYSQQKNLYEEDVENIENLLQQISINEQNIGNVYEEYQLRRYDTDYDIHPTEKKMLSREVMNVLQILGERQDTETLQVMLQRIGEAGGNYRSISNIISEYLSSDLYNSYDIRIGGFLKGNQEIYELLQVIASAEDATEVVNAAKRLKEQQSITENFVQVIDDYLMFFSNAERIAAREPEPAAPSAATLELVELLSGSEEEEPSDEELGKIKEIVKKSELYDRSIKERILELATASTDKEKEAVEEGTTAGEAAETRLIQNLTNQNISELSYENIEQIKELVISSSEPYGTEIKQRILELTTGGSGKGTGAFEGITGWEEPETELISILTDESINELSVQNIEQIKRIVAGMPKSYDRSIKQRILEYIEVAEKKAKGAATETTAAQEEAKARLYQFLTEENINELTAQNIEQVKNVVAKMPVSYERSVMERVIDLVTASWEEETNVPSAEVVENQVRTELVQLLSNENINELSFENVEQIKEVIRKTSELSTKEKEKLLETVTSGQIRMLEEVKADNEAEREVRQELINILSDSKNVSAPEENIEKIRTIVRRLEGGTEKYKFFIENERENLIRERKSAVERIIATKEFDNILEQTIEEIGKASLEEGKQIPDTADIRQEIITILRQDNPEILLENAPSQVREIYNVLQTNIRNFRLAREGQEGNKEVSDNELEFIAQSEKLDAVAPADIIYERASDEISYEENVSKLIIKREELIGLIKEFRSAAAQEIAKAADVRNIVNLILAGEEKKRTSYEVGSQQEAVKRISEIITESAKEASPASAELIYEKIVKEAADEEIASQLTERKVELTELIREFVSRSSLETVKTSDINTIIERIIMGGERQRISEGEGTGKQEVAKAGVEVITGSEKTYLPSPAQLIYEKTIEEASDEETDKELSVKKEELINLLLEKRSSTQETVKTTDVRNILNQMMSSGEKQRTAVIQEGKGYEAFGPTIRQEFTEEMIVEETPEEAQGQPQKEGTVTDEEIRRLTENVNRINVENELRRRQYIETIRNIESRKPRESAADALEKTRKRAIMALESPEVLRETLNNERIVKENREKEILKELQGIFPDQSMEIYQLINRYQSNPDQLIEENILRPAEVGELLFDLNDAMREPTESQEMSVAQLNRETMQEIPEDRVRPQMVRMQEEATTSRTPAETVHKITESLSSDELNEQLEMMKHNLTRQIKEEVKSDVVTENRHTNAKEVVTTDSTTQQLSQVNIQRMIDSTVRSEMNTISNQVMSKIERQMRNEKIRRGY